MERGDPLDTPEEVADYLKFPKDTLLAWRYKRVGPPYLKVGKHIRYRRSEVDQWLERQQPVRA